MPEFRQQFFKPGRYHVGGGRYLEFSPADVSSYVTGTKALLSAGLGVPVIYEHPDPGTEAGAPRPIKGRWQKNADLVRNTVGWLKDVEVQSDGSAVHVLDIKDPDAAKKIESGITKYTSPELRKQFIDGKGNVFNNVFSHVALTNKPRNQDQTEFTAVESPALQFSLEDYMPVTKSKKPAKSKKSEAVQFAEDEKEVKVEDKPEEEKVDEQKPDDAPPDADADEDVEQTPRSAIEQLVQNASKLGLCMPEDTNGSNIVHYLNVAIMTKLKHEEDNTAEEPQEETELVEDKPPLQFALNELDNCENKLLAKVIRQDHESLVKTLASFPPALRDALLARESVHQFSVEGERLPLLTVAEVVEIIAKNVPENFGVQFSAAKEEKHPQGEAFYTGGEVSAEMAKKIVDEKARYIPTLAGSAK
jgi:hypothetical protein